MNSRLKRITAVASTLVLTASLFGIPASAMQYTGTESYMSGKYYRRLEQVKLTGDPRTDIVAIAKSQVGYQEGGSDGELSGEVYGGINFTECGAWYGLQDMWCAMFVSWCADLAGVSTDTVPSHCSTPLGLSWFAERGLAYSRAEVQSRKYTPKPGDIIYFKSSRNAKPTNHVGIVTAYSNGRIYTVEGNVGAIGKTTGGGMVAEQSYPISNTYIVYICSPNYESGSTSVPAENHLTQKELQQESLREALFTLEAGEGLTYDAVNVDLRGGVTLGCGQWYGSQASALLNRIYQADPAAYEAADPERALLETGSLNRLTAAMTKQLQAVLASEAGIQIQNAWMDQSLADWTAQAQAQGVSDQDSLLLCAALYQLCGAAFAERIIEKAGDDPSRDQLLGVIKASEPGLYRTCCLLVE